MSKAITEKTEDKPQGWQPGVEIAPSLVREDEPTTARTIGLVGAWFVIFGSVALLIPALRGQEARIGVGWASLCLALGVVGLLYHAASDRDLQVRRLYWGGGLALLLLGTILCIVPSKGAEVGGLFGLGYPCLFAALLFLLAVHRHETDPTIQKITLRVLGGVGLGMSVVGSLFCNNFRGEFLVPSGLLLALLGLVYLTAFVNRQGIATDLGFKASLGIGAIGVVAFVIGLLRSALPLIFYKWGWAPRPE